MAAPLDRPDGEQAQAVEELEIELLLEAVYRRFGHDFRDYRRAPLQARLRALLRRTALPSVSALQARVLHDDMAAAQLLRALSAGPSALFDDPGYFQALRALLVPWLRSCPVAKIWVAECLCAEEVYAHAILLAEEGLLGRTQIFATAENEGLLEDASSGSFASGRLPLYGRNYVASGGRADVSDYCAVEGERTVFSRELRDSITWAQFSLAENASFNEFQFIVCRRAMSDFGPRLRRRALQLFYDSMPLFGMLAVDRAAGLEGTPLLSCFAPLPAEQGLYRRIV